MKQIFVLTTALLLTCAYQVSAQTSGPRKPPTATRSTSAEPTTRSTEAPAPPTANSAETRVVNGLNITLKRVKGNPADQTVTLDLLISNPKSNARVILLRAYAVDTEGDNYQDALNGGWSMDEILYTDVPRKASVRVRGVPSKIKTLALFKFVVANNGDVELEYRNLAIDWQ